jgi:hypothetical protein
MSFELNAASGKFMRTIAAGLAQFEKSVLAVAKARGSVLGRQFGFRPSDNKARKVLAMHHGAGCYIVWSAGISPDPRTRSRRS